MSYPKGVIHRVICRLTVLWDRLRGKKRATIRSPPGFVVFVFCPCWFQASKLLDGGQDTQSSGPGNRLRPVVGIEFTVDIAGVDLDRVRREEKPGSDFWIG